MQLRQPDEWQSLAQAILTEVIATYARYGVIVAPELRVVPEGGPIPAYHIEQQQIAFHMPDPSTALGRLGWLYYQNLSGAADLYDVQETIEANLPLVMAHEVAHHLRFHYDVAAASLWREEQVAQLMGLSFVAEHPRYAETLPKLQHYTRRSAKRLSEIARKRDSWNAYELRAGYDTLAHRVLAEGLVSPEELAEAEAFAMVTGTSLEEVLRTEGLVSERKLELLNASAARVEQRFNDSYMVDVTQYWLAGTTWLLPHLERRDWPPLGRLIENFLRTTNWQERQQAEARLALEASLYHPRPMIAGAAALGLIELEGEEARETILRALPNASPTVRQALRQSLATLDAPAMVVTTMMMGLLPERGVIEARLRRVNERAIWAAALADSPLGMALQADVTCVLSVALGEIAQLCDTRTINQARPLLRHPDPLIRKQARELILATIPTDLRQWVEPAIHPPTQQVERAIALEQCRQAGEWLAALAALSEGPTEPEMLTRAEKFIYLRAVSAFATLSPDHIWSLSERAVHQQFADGEMIYREGEPGERFYVVTHGAVKLWTQGRAARPSLISRLEAGESFGVLEVFDRGARAFTARASGPTWLLYLEQSDLIALALQEPTMLLGIIEALSAKLRAVDLKLEQAKPQRSARTRRRVRPAT